MSERVFLESVRGDLWSQAWEAQSCADQQGELAVREVSKWKNGGPVKPFDVFREMVESVFGHSSTFRLLEVGCGTGHYSQVLWHLWPHAIYAGLDYSPAMIQTAMKMFKSQYDIFIRGEAEILPFSEGTYDVVVLGSVLGCCNDWRAAINEAFRVSSKYVLMHRVAVHNFEDWPDVRDSVKTAYNVEMAERIIRDSLITSIAKSAGARCVRNSAIWSQSDHGFQLSVLFEK